GARKGVEKEIVLQIVERFRGKYTIIAILGALNVPQSNYYRWRAEEVSAQLSVKEEAIIELCKRTKYRNGHRKIKDLLKKEYKIELKRNTVKAIMKKHNRQRKIKALLKKEYKIELNRNTVQAIMQKHNLQCRIKPKRKWKSQGESVIIAPDLLERNFTASAPNKKWVTDITYIQYGSTVKYLSTIMDLFN